MALLHLHQAAPRHRARQRDPWLPALIVAGVAVTAFMAWGLASVQVDDDAESGTAPAATQDRGSPADVSPADVSSAPGASPSPELKVRLGSRKVGPMEALAVQGSMPGALPGVALKVQRLDPAGRWVTFPLRPVVDEAGAFRTFVEIGEPGVHRLRVVEPISGTVSRAVAVRVG